MVSFDPERWDDAHAGLIAAGIPPARITEHHPQRCTQDQIRDAYVHAWPLAGIAVVDVDRGAPKQALVDRFRTAVRDQRTLRRVPVAWGPSPERDAQPAPWQDDGERCWPLRALDLDGDEPLGRGITVGIVDTGVDRRHPALAGRVRLTRSYVAGASPDEDAHGHGTHVAGLIAGSARTRPRFGIAPYASLHSYRIYGDNETSDELALVLAVEAAVHDGCRIIVIATGRQHGKEPDPTDMRLGAYAAARGALLVAAAGNDSDRPGTVLPIEAPANAAMVYAIGASTRTNMVWTRSNGDGSPPPRNVDWVAPGQFITSAFLSGTTHTATGTSAATGVAAGVAAAVWSRRPSWRPEDVVAELSRLAIVDDETARAAVGNGRMRLRMPQGAAPIASSSAIAHPRSRRSPVSEDFSEPFDVVGAAERLRATNPNARIRVYVIDVQPDGGAAVPPAGAADIVMPDPATRTALRTQWNMQGHSVIAMLAGDILQEEAPAKYSALLDIASAATLDGDDGGGDLGSLAQWPDRIKTAKNLLPVTRSLGQTHKPDHYVNYVFDGVTPAKVGEEKMQGKGTILSSLREFAQTVRKQGNAVERLQALAFVLHLVGDIHQPLHCAVLVNERFPHGDEGGNGIWIGTKDSLHGYWDEAVVNGKGKGVLERARAALAAGLDAQKYAESRAITDPVAWARESYDLAVKAYAPFLDKAAYLREDTRTVFGKPKTGSLFKTPPKDYIDWMHDVSAERARIAAYRLADVLAGLV